MENAPISVTLKKMLKINLNSSALAINILHSTQYLVSFYHMI